MRVLVASLAIDGHVNPLTGVAKQLQADGHDVEWYTGSHMASRLQALGIKHHPFVRAVEHTADNLNDIYPRRRRLRGPQLVAFDGEKVFSSNVGNFFEDIREIRDSFRFDVLLLDGAVYVQRLVVELLEVPVVSVVSISNMEHDPLVPPLFFGFTPATSWRGRVRDRVAGAISDRLVMGRAQRTYTAILAGYGVRLPHGALLSDEPYATSAVVVQNGSESFDYPRSRTNPRVHYVGALTPYRPSPAGEPDLATTAATYARTVLVTQGTVDNQDVDKLIVPTVEALRDTDTLLLVATGGSGTAALRTRYPDVNVVVEDRIDFGQALQVADVYVTNGGFGGVMLSLAHGVPMVCAGTREGKNDVNAHVEYHRAGINLRTEHPTPAAIRTAVDRLTDEPQWRARARQFAEELRDLDAGREAADLVTALVPPPDGGDAKPAVTALS